MKKKIIVLEMNEVPDRVIDSYIGDNPSSHWASIIKRSARFIAATPDQIQLHPKISWQTFHRGVPDHQHGFLEFNQTESEGTGHFPPLWEIIAGAGRKIGCGASIGSYPVPEKTDGISFYLTDPFAPTFETVPAYLGAFQRVNNLAVQRSGRNVRPGGFSVAEVSSLLFNLPRLGISLSTIAKTVKQLIAERRNSARIVRRRNIQALLTFDIVFKQLKKTRPEFSTIFANQIAACMHRYWAAKFPDDYDVNRMPQEWRDTYADEIDAAMDEADYMLGKLDKFVKANPEFTVMVVGSMGQEAIEHELIRNQLIICDFDAFMRTLGFNSSDYEKLTGMEPEYVVEFKHEDGLKKFEQVCRNTEINGHSPDVKPRNETQCTFEVFHNNIDITSIKVSGKSIDLGDAGLIIEDIQDMSGSTAQHVPVGCCFVFDGVSDLSGHSDMNNEHDLVAVTSSILAALDIVPAPYMKSPVPAIVEALCDRKLQSEAPASQVEPPARQVEQQAQQDEPQAQKIVQEQKKTQKFSSADKPVELEHE